METNRIPSTYNFEIILSRLLIVKILELVLICCCVILDCYSYNPIASPGILVSGTFVGYLIIFAGITAGQVMQTPLHKNIDLFYSLVGIGLFMASGACIIHDMESDMPMDPKQIMNPAAFFTPKMLQDPNQMLNDFEGNFRRKNLAKASLAIINGAVLLIDAVLTERGG